jgi:hypothetical protein
LAPLEQAASVLAQTPAQAATAIEHAAQLLDSAPARVGGEHAEPQASAPAQHAPGVDTQAIAADHGAAPTALLQGTDAPVASDHAAPFIDMGAIPSAAALIAAAATVEDAAPAAQGKVGAILAEALHGGGAQAHFDALVHSLPGKGGSDAAASDSAAAASASPADSAVPLLDVSHFAGLHPAAAFTMEALVLHHDAAQLAVHA